jgi:hypothetical protein
MKVESIRYNNSPTLWRTLALGMRHQRLCQIRKQCCRAFAVGIGESGAADGTGAQVVMVGLLAVETRFKLARR